MSSYVPARLRKLVAERARGLCVHCLIHEDDSYVGCEIEHVISEKHGGRTITSNLAWARAMCNDHKGSDIASVSPTTGALSRLYDPRADVWSEHFQLKGVRIVGKSDVGKVTVILLKLNAPKRMEERRQLMRAGRFPSSVAAELIAKEPR